MTLDHAGRQLFYRRGGFLVYKFIASVIAGARPPETEHNRFSQKKKVVKPKQLEKPAKGVKFLYRLARKSERSRHGYKGEKWDREEATVGREAEYMLSKPWALRPTDSAYYGVDGLDDTCIHLSTAAQVVETAKLYYKGVDDVLLLKFSTDMIEKDDFVILRWEQALPPPGQPARPDAFPHVYARERGFKAKLSWWNLEAAISLPLGADGETVEFPENALSEDAKAAVPTPTKGEPAGYAAAAAVSEAVEDLDAMEARLRKEAGLS